MLLGKRHQPINGAVQNYRVRVEQQDLPATSTGRGQIIGARKTQILS
jgi:hypothetical protein